VARQAASIRAAMWIELSYFPEQTGADTAYSNLRAEYRELVSQLCEAVNDPSESGRNSFVSVSLGRMARAEYGLTLPAPPIDY
jgi:hypothetical protein